MRTRTNATLGQPPTFSTDGNGDSGGFDIGRDSEDQPFTARITIWPDPNENLIQDPGEPTVFSGSFVNDNPQCQGGIFVPD